MEFGQLTNNEAYLSSFCKRVMKPSLEPLDPFIGNTQRKDFIPLLSNLIKQLPDKPHVFDVGGGNGEMVDLILKKNIPNSAYFTVVEPNSKMLQEYICRLEKANIRVNESFQSPVQDVYRKNLQKPADLIIAVHMIYHLVDWCNSNFTPDKELIEFIKFLYSQLKPRGRIFLAFADDEQGYVGQATVDYYRKKHDQIIVDRLNLLYKSQNQLLAAKGIEEYLTKEWPMHKPKLSIHKFDSKFFGETKDDLSAMALISGIIPFNEQPFDINKLFCTRQFIEENSESIGLKQELEPGERQYMWKSCQPQVVCVIEKGET
ncbi:methyltransferase domain-containing protein [Endozoicomonas sp. SM1973]|uniref:Methyltransferase domain-containing protein n=1 Tax=Spartinivicinus marinus TaxID=2994442 RepID=A0A853IGM4_9GAMM|nr:methyltransferase domain-containing protein [Spartinivicinus marinus]MCX4026411.1 methyltransferase domain-containing protein [Spartinivicinus marinus]NYZ69164.1 methyltransferase domain-containing protein [Spartinivicinus marinus]